MMIRNCDGQGRRSLKSNDTKEKSRWNREAKTIKLRKQKRDDRLKTRRQTSVPTDGPVTVAISPDTQGKDQAIQQQITECITIFKQWEKHPNGMVDQFTRAIGYIRKILSNDKPPVAQVLDAGLLPYLFEALRFDDSNPDLQEEAAWALTNITSSDNTSVVAEFPGLVVELARLLIAGRRPGVRDQCAWCLGNIAGESSKYREALLEMDSVRDGLISNIQYPEEKWMVKNFTWATMNLVKMSTKVPIQQTIAFVKPLIDLLRDTTLNDRQLLSDICYALSFLAEGDPEDGARAAVLLKFNALGPLVALLEKTLLEKKPPLKVLNPLIRCLGMFASGTAEQASALLETSFMEHINTLLNFDSKVIQKETAWVCSNIAAGTHDQGARIARNAKALAQLSELAASGHYDVRIEALWALCHLLEFQSDPITFAVLQAGAMRAFCANLDLPSVEVVLRILDSIVIMFQCNARTYNDNSSLVHVFEEEGGTDKIQRLTQHESHDVYLGALQLIEDYIGVENHEYEENGDIIHPETCGGVYTFGSPKQLFREQDRLDFNVSEVRIDGPTISNDDHMLL